MPHRIGCAYFSPLPPERSGIADYSADLLPYIAEHVNLTLYSQAAERVSAQLRAQYRVESISSYRRSRWDYEIGLYQIGNNLPFHGAYYDIALRCPGIVVLHDRMLHHLQLERTVARGNHAAYARELGYSQGVEGFRYALRIARHDMEYPVWSLPLTERLVDTSLGVMVHSLHAARDIRSTSTDTPVKVIAQPMEIPSVDESFRARLPWPRDAIIFATVGQLTPYKRIDTFLEALRRVRLLDRRVRALLIGEWRPEWIDLPGMIARLHLHDAVYHVGYAPSIEEMSSWIAAADVVVNLRNPTAGETSAGALRALAAGRPVIVYDHGWYSELPDTVSVKIPPGNGDALAREMLRLAGDGETRARLASACVPYILSTHSPARVAQDYAAFMREVIG